MKKVGLLIFAFLVLGLLTFKTANSYLTDTETKTGNLITVATDFGSPVPNPSSSPIGSATPSPTISPLPSPSPSSLPSPSPTLKLVINEVYYDPDATHMSGTDENAYEWVEIYNAGSAPVNLKNWKIVDGTAAERTITTNDYNLVVGNFVMVGKLNDIKTFWSIPDDKFIALGQDIGSGLNNTGDRVILKDEVGQTVDEMFYGNDTAVWNPAAGPIGQGHSLERNPDGLDNNMASDFVDRSSPIPGS